MTYNEETKTFTIETAEEAVELDGVMEMVDFNRDPISILVSMVGEKVLPSEVLAAITPSEGDAVFWWYNDEKGNVSPEYTTVPEIVSAYVTRNDFPIVKANALTIGKTVGELRELLRQARRE